MAISATTIDGSWGLVNRHLLAATCVVFQTHKHKTRHGNVHLRFHVASSANVPNARELGGAWGN